jgi:DNA-binding winged helix-turn-helix (wHTH) protein
MNTEMVFPRERTNGGSPGIPQATASGYLKFGTFHVDLKREELFKDGTRVRLPGKVYQALLALLEQPGEVVSRGALRQRLWPEGTHVNYDANVNTTVNKLRQALGDTPEEPKYVETIPRQGYSFVGAVEMLESLPHTNGNGAVKTLQAREGAAATNGWFRGSVVGSSLTPGWLKASAIALVIAGMLFGAALVIYARHAL